MTILIGILIGAPSTNSWAWADLPNKKRKGDKCEIWTLNFLNQNTVIKIFKKVKFRLTIFFENFLKIF